MNELANLDRIVSELSPIDDQELLEEARSPLARALFDQVVATDPAGPSKRRAIGLRLAAAAGAAIALALGVVGIVSGQAPSAAPPASAKTIGRIVAALEQRQGAILHVALAAEETTATGRTASWSQEAWILYPAAHRFPATAFMQRVSQPGGPDFETSVGTPSRQGGLAPTQLYDPSTNTIYTGTPVLAPGVGLPVDVFSVGASATPPHPEVVRANRLDPACHSAGSFDVLMADSEVSAASGAPAAAVSEVIAGTPYMGPVPLFSLLSPAATTTPLPWLPDVGEQLLRALHGCGATVVGYAAIDGHRTIEIADPGLWTYYADATSHRPVELDLIGQRGASLRLRFTAFDELAPEAKPLSVAANHPTAMVDSSPAAYEAAQARLFPNGAR